nr:RNA-directed DNA polymerase, eukaryota, reverse transcriptase zinc-binding domain protein [Tanacetum cinerariifolium]
MFTHDSSEHSTGSSSITKDMQDFKDRVNLIKVEDIASSGLFFTWTKNLHKSKQGDTTGILKNLDRAMRNEAFVCEFEGDKVAEQFVNHFKQFVGESIPANKLQGYNELFKKKLSNDEAEFMVREVSNAEVKKAMFMINNNKAPGPDGYTSYFLRYPGI